MDITNKIYRQPDCILPLSFFEGRFIPDFHEDSLDYEQWWEEQIRRCREGFTDGGYTVTGPYYYHLNFKKINMLDVNERPLIEHPFYSFEDQELFNDVAKARAAKKGVMLITGRGFGKSYDTSSIVEHEFTFYDATECIVSASTDFFAAQTWQKVEMGLNSQPDAIRLNLLVGKTDFMYAGDIVTIQGKKKKIGSFAKIFKVVYDDDEGRTRGTRPNIHVWEEIGSWSGAAKLIKCYKATEPSWWRGSVFTCLPILIGTGGQMMQGASKDAKEMAFNPDAYNLQSYIYNDQKIVKFYPAYVKFGGYYEKSGVSDVVGAKLFLDNRRKQKEPNIEMFRQECQEFPFDIFEAFEESGTSNFDKERLGERYNTIWRTPSMKAMVEKGDLKPVYAGGKIIDVEFYPNPKGDFEFISTEHPRKDPATGHVVPHLYISGCDSFDSFEEEVRPELSPGSLFVYKRFWKASEVGRVYVAKITLRTRNGDEFYAKTLLMNMYYGCQMLYEHTNKGIGTWYRTQGQVKYLYPRPSLDKAIKNSKTTNLYGVAMPGPVKSHAINLYKTWQDQADPDGIGSMFFLSQLKDAMDFRYGSKEHHETMAASIALLADEDMYDVKIKEMKKESRHFPKFVRDQYGNMDFKYIPKYTPN